MKKETWFNAEELLREKLVDEIIDTGRKIELAAMQPKKLVAKLIDENFKPDSDMKLIALAMGLPETATEQQIVDAINKQKSELTSAKAVVATSEKALVDQMVAQGKANGTITDDNEADMRELAVASPKLFNKMVAKATSEDGKDVKDEAKNDQPLRLSDVLAAMKTQTGGGDTKTEAEQWDNLQKNDPSALAKMEIAEPEKFKKLQNAYEKSLG
jgi:hypothetical protein